MSMTTSGSVPSVRFTHSQHPFAVHESAFQSLICLRKLEHVDPAVAQKAMLAAYQAALDAAARMCGRLGLRPSEEHAMEAVHELFCQLRPHAAKGYDSARPLYPYVYAALWYVVCGIGRREQKHDAAPFDNDSIAVVEEPYVRLHVRELWESMDALPEGQRDAIKLRYFSGMNSDEAAATLSITAGAFDVRVHRGLKRLRERFS